MFISNSSRCRNQSFPPIYLFNSSFISRFIKNIPQNIDRIIRIFLSILTLPFFLSTNNLKPTTFSSIWSSSWSIFQFHDSIVSKKKKKYPFQRTKKGDPFQEESPIPNNSKSFLETWILLSPRKDHGRNSKVLPCPWPWLKRVTVHFYSRWPVRHVIRYKGSATKRGRQAL